MTDINDFKPIRLLRLDDLGAPIAIRDSNSIITGLTVESLEAMSAQTISGALIFDSVALHTTTGMTIYLSENAEYRQMEPNETNEETYEIAVSR